MWEEKIRIGDCFKRKWMWLNFVGGELGGGVWKGM